jgi:hypothetical protein
MSSKLSYYTYIVEPTSQLQATTESVSNKVPWGGRCKMRPERVAQPKELGGFNLHPLELRASAQKAWLYYRASKHPILGQMWTDKQSPLARAFWEHSSRFNTKSTVLSELISSQLKPPALTAGQRELEVLLDCSVYEIFTKINKLWIRKAIKQICWRFFNKCLPINKQNPIKCPHNKQNDDHKHLALNCKLIDAIQTQANSVINNLTGKSFKYDPRKAILLQGANNQQNILNSIIIWIQRQAHNEWTHKSKSTPTLNQTKATIVSEVKQYVCSQIAQLKARPRKQKKNKH